MSRGQQDARIAAGTHVALLRGINLAGKNKLLMKDLVEIFVEAGCTHVRTSSRAATSCSKQPLRWHGAFPPR